jgi:hypothetical protein
MREKLADAVIHLRSFSMSEFGTAEVRTYRARVQSDAEALLADDLASMGQRGLAPSNQVWSAPRSWRAVVTPIVLLVVGFVLLGLIGAAGGALIGIAYMLVVRPKGTLTVTFSPSRVSTPAWTVPAGPATMSFAEPLRSAPWSRQRR